MDLQKRKWRRMMKSAGRKMEHLWERMLGR